MGRSYKRIAAVRKTLQILNHLATKQDLTSGHTIAAEIDMPYLTLMCHLATLEDVGVIRKIGDHYELSMALAVLWAKRKRCKKPDSTHFSLYKSNTSYKRIAAVSRAIEILYYIFEQPEAVSGAEAAAALDIPYDTMMCYLATLEEDGYVRSRENHHEGGFGVAKIWARIKSREESRLRQAEELLSTLDGKIPFPEGM